MRSVLAVVLIIIFLLFIQIHLKFVSMFLWKRNIYSNRKFTDFLFAFYCLPKFDLKFLFSSTYLFVSHKLHHDIANVFVSFLFWWFQLFSRIKVSISMFHSNLSSNYQQFMKKSSKRYNLWNHMKKMLMLFNRFDLKHIK